MAKHLNKLLSKIIQCEHHCTVCHVRQERDRPASESICGWSKRLGRAGYTVVYFCLLGTNAMCRLLFSSHDPMTRWGRDHVCVSSQTLTKAVRMKVFLGLLFLVVGISAKYDLLDVSIIRNPSTMAPALYPLLAPRSAKCPQGRFAASNSWPRNKFPCQSARYVDTDYFWIFRLSGENGETSSF